MFYDSMSPTAKASIVRYCVAAGLRSDPSTDVRTFSSPVGTIVESGAKFAAACDRMSLDQGDLGRFLADRWGVSLAERYYGAAVVLRELGYRDAPIA